VPAIAMTDDASGLEWTPGAGPRSRRFGDVYFSEIDGLAESRAVFLAGCSLPDAWARRGRFTVGELGFGTGLNILALLDLWRQARPAGGRLHIFSVEAYPLTRDEAAQALGAWPELAEVAAPLLAAWPSFRPGFHRVDFPGLDAILDLYLGEVEAGLTAWDGRADAWFLDGFAPSKNPQMWSQAVLDLVAARSAPGARIGTFTVAGAVRRGLAQAGFTVAKQPGFGRKNERLEAVLPGEAPTEPALPRVAVIGAGIAGAAMARAFRVLGAEVQVVDTAGAGAGASGNAAALVTPRLDAGGGAVSALHAQAFDRATALYAAEAPGAVLATSALQLEAGPRDAGRFDRIAAWDGFAPGTAVRVSAREAAGALQEPAEVGGLMLAKAMTVAPLAILERWLGPTVRAEVAGLQRAGAGWRLIGADGAVVLEADVVCLAAGPHSARLAALGPLRAVRGQATMSDRPLPGAAASWGGYAVPTVAGLLFGATHDRDDWDTDVREGDRARNLAGLATARPGLAASLQDAALAGRASLRAATPDHMPLAGKLDEGLFVLTGLGGRGFTLAPLLAEQVAALAMDAARPLPRGLAAMVDPARYPKTVSA
jgi:tRNA 5-methylaminomethyl-2-thiouridine biosynthesis bifunctional protein